MGQIRAAPTEEEIAKITRAARRLHRECLHVEWEDMLQMGMVGFLKDGHTRYIRRRIIDELRDTYGSLRHLKHNQVTNTGHNWRPSTHNSYSLTCENGEVRDIRDQSEPVFDYLQIIQKIFQRATERERRMMWFIYEGYLNTEVGFFLDNVTGARITQLLTKLGNKFAHLNPWR